MFTSSEFPGDDEAERSERANMANETQRNVTFETFVGALSDVAFKIARNEIVYTDRVAKYEFEKVKSAAVNYVSAMGSNSIIFEPPDNEDQFNDAMDTLRQGGWILAGNYYQVLSSIEGTSDFKVYSGNTPNPNFNPSDNDHKVEVGRVDAFYENFDNWDGKVFEQAAQTATQMSREEVENAFNGQSEIFDEMGLTQASADHMEGFLKMISGEEGSTDPVLRAARYGQDLMNTSAKAMITIASLMPLLALGFGWCTASMPGELIWNSMLTSTLPIAYGMLGFLYLQGAALGVYLPMIPLIIFVIGGIGWIFSVIEAMVAAPLVALGLTIEGQNEMYGKAEPAVMILISVLLRPSLMMVGFLTSIMVAWLAVDLINISMMSALEFGGVAPDWMFGHHVVSFMYVGILIALVTKVFGLINYVPEQVWKYLGVNDRNPIAPDEVLSGGRQGGDAMAKQTGDTAQATANSGTTLGQGAGRDFAGKPELTKGGDEKT
jgi:conjugal transfer/type IV secretion protein DotA/TraY